RRHAIARVGVGAAQVEAEHPAQDAREHHREHPDHEKRRGPGRGVVEEVECLAHYLRYASTIAFPSAPPVASHSAGIVSPIFLKADLSCAEGGATFMPFFASSAR